MNAVLATMPFLATLWLLWVLGAAILEKSGGKITAALKGKPVQQTGTGSTPLRVGMRPVTPTGRRASVEWRAAA
jgi:hypothetical protein